MIFLVIVLLAALVYGILSAVLWSIGKAVELEDEWIKDHGA